jgi:hypothetical protein
MPEGNFDLNPLARCHAAISSGKPAAVQKSLLLGRGALAKHRIALRKPTKAVDYVSLQ